MLLETLIDPRYFRGTVYQVANLIPVGQSLGYTRQGVHHKYHGHLKEVYLHPFKKDSRAIVGSQERPSLEKKPSFSSDPLERSERLTLLGRIGWDPRISAELKIKPEDVAQLTGLMLDFRA
ncbi:MAG TPA: hypothetical protein VLH18_02565 [Candidatus Limnocylindrales bacterium]|nr:hypothetical protein [Candidatus Limnocylindrales bacterium]